MRRSLALVFASVAAACSSGPSASPPPPCSVAAQTGCGAGQYCEVQGTSSACFAPVILRGTVVDPTGAGTTVGGARVVALDPTRAPGSSVATTGADGVYELAVRADRDATGRPTGPSVTLRADAEGYQTFPSGLRPALPIDPLSAATLVSGRWVISAPQTPLTRIELFPLATAGTGRIAGTVTRVTGVAAPLVVAEPQGVTTVATATAFAGTDGAYVLFNLTPGVRYVVRPYAKGVNWSASAPTLPAAPAIVNFAAPTATAAGVSGDLIFRTGSNTSVDVELVVDSTYDSTLDRGEVPPGLAVHVSGNQPYAFTGVPDGHYRVLAAYGVDGDVRDQSVPGNTTPPTVTVSGGASATPSASFAITPAIDLVSIGGRDVGLDPVIVVTMAQPVFAWTNAGVTSADVFYVHVFDAFGATQWEPAAVPKAASMEISYGGTALVVGQTYQLRIVGIQTSGNKFQSQTEDLLGVFTYEP